ncbi:unnamed protein product [Rodentolepis nana]|uniref:Histone-lysine N-methyltransferase n=1 Tax=Rodentolepis nana TaxID=102285 RepID=A0A0R3TAX7_RODNA|nr:unnamed protein product [Rodentolepis nana]
MCDIFVRRRLSNRKSKPTMADLVDQHRLGFVAATNSYGVVSPSPSIRLNNYSPSGSNINSLTSHFVHSDQLDSAGILGSESTRKSEFNLMNENPSSFPPTAEEDEDNLPLSDLCKRVNHPSTDNSSVSPLLCASSNCSFPVSRTDERLGGRYCSVECLIRACHQAFCDAFPKFTLEQDERLDYRIPLKSTLPKTFTNPEGLVS